jgi:hypothetical protein
MTCASNCCGSWPPPGPPSCCCCCCSWCCRDAKAAGGAGVPVTTLCTSSTTSKDSCVSWICLQTDLRCCFSSSCLAWASACASFCLRLDLHSREKVHVEMDGSITLYGALQDMYPRCGGREHGCGPWEEDWCSSWLHVLSAALMGWSTVPAFMQAIEGPNVKCAESW